MRKILILLCALPTSYAIGMNTQINSSQLFVIPGQNGLGGQNIDKILPGFEPKKVKTPCRYIDFGQTNCQKLLKDQIGPNDRDILIHASSQGTATAINWTANNPDKVKALILESVLLTGNSAIHHTMDSMIFPGIGKVPGSYYLFPYLAKLIFPFYAPAGEQPIFNAENLPKNLPIIIIHATKDAQLNFKDAQALYAFLKSEMKHDNVYLMPIDKESHVLLLGANSQETKGIKSILANHNLYQKENTKDVQEELQTYQPKVQQEWLDHFTDRKRQENKIWYFDKTLKASLFALIAYLFYQSNMIDQISEKLNFNQ